MSILSLDRLRREGQTFMQAISREIYLAHSGQKANPRATAAPQRGQLAPAGAAGGAAVVTMSEVPHSVQTC